MAPRVFRLPLPCLPSFVAPDLRRRRRRVLQRARTPRRRCGAGLPVLAGALSMAVLSGGTARAQPAGEPSLHLPVSLTENLAPLSEVVGLRAPPVRPAAGRAAAAPGEPLRFAEPFAVDVSPASHGRWEIAEGGRTAVWRLPVRSAGAVSLNLAFTRYRMPPGGRLFLHAPDGGEVVGPFTEADNKSHGELWTPVISGEEAVVEVSVPADRAGELELELGSVNRGFRALSDVVPARHASCQVDVACSDADGHRDQVRSVGLFTRGGVGACTGALVNNTAHDGTPYFLAAAHCGFSHSFSLPTPHADVDAIARSVVVYWNYESPTCGQRSGGSKDQSQSGARFRAMSTTTDFVLLELDDPPAAAHNLYYAGWARAEGDLDFAVGIHHPRGHVKSFATTTDADVARTSDGLPYRDLNGAWWWVRFWTAGGIEGGSSGSPLFDADGRVVGQLSGGGSSVCLRPPASEIYGPTYGRLAKSWTGGGTLGSRLSDWLDPGGTGAAAIDGRNWNRAPEAVGSLDGQALKFVTGETPASLAVDVAYGFLDLDGDDLTYAASSSDETVATVTVSGSTLTLTPAVKGTATVTVTATDADGLDETASQELAVTVGDNTSPEAVGTIEALVRRVRDGAEEVDVAGAFRDAEGDALTYGASSSDGSVARVSLSGTTVTVTPVAPGVATVTATATDAAGSGTTARQRFEVVVNRGPVAAERLPALSLRVETGAEDVDVSAAFEDPDGDDLTYAASSSDETVATVSVSGLAVTVTPVNAGTAVVTVTATDVDGANLSATRTFEATVANRPPVAVGSLEAVTMRLGDRSYIHVDVEHGFSDPDGDRLRYTASRWNGGVVNAAMVNGGPTLSLRPRSAGSATVTITATDVEGSNTPVQQQVAVRVLPARGVGVDPVSVTVDEGSSASYDVVLKAEPTGSVTVTPSAPSGTDVSVSPSSLTFTDADWDVSQPVTVAAAEDTDGASDAPVTIRNAVSGGDYGSVRADSVVVTILENDTSALSTVDGSAPERGGELAFEVTISVAGTADVTVDYATSDGTARAGSDYTATSGTLTFPQGSASSQSIRVPVLDDGADEEEEETFRLTLSNVRNGVLAGGGSTLRVTGTIEDDDDPEVTVSFGRSRYDVAEGAAVSVEMRLDKDPERALSVPLEATYLDGASPADYAGVPLEATFGPGQRSAEFLFSATDDSEVDAGESVELQFGSLLPPGVTAGPAAVVAIRDNDDGGRDPGGGDPGRGGPGGGRPPRPPNRPPEAVGTLEDQALTVGAEPVAVDVAAAFRDPDRDALEYAAESSAEDVAAAAVDGSVVTVTPVGAGTAAVTVTASDGEEGNAPAEQAFTVTVVVDYDSDADGLIEVRTPAQLDAVRHDLDGDGVPAEAGAEAHAAAFAGAIGGVSCAAAGGCRGYELLADLDLDTNGSGGPDAGDAYWRDGSGWLPIGTGAAPFAAAFEGNGRVIRGLFVARGAGGAGAGLFGATAPSSVVARVGLIGADVTGTRAVGILAGRNGGRVTAGWAAGRVSGSEAVGGLVGSNSGNIGGSYAAVAVAGGRQAGGLVGVNEGGLAAVYATGRVSGTAAVGGLVGHHRGTLTAGYATGLVRGEDDVGGLVGTLGEPGTAEAPGTVTASYWDTETSGAASSAAGRGLTTSALQRPTAYGGLYAGWNVDADGDGILDGPWHLGTAAQYPALALDVDGDGRASWPELGRQLRAGPVVTAAPAENLAAENLAEVALTWTAADTSAWKPGPEVTYTVTREAGATVETGARVETAATVEADTTVEAGARAETVAAGVRGTRYVDADVQPGSTYTYQVAAVVDGGEAAHSGRVTTEVPCAYAATPPHRDVLWAAGAGQVAVTTGPGCAWTAASESAFLAVAGGATGTGPGTVRYTVAANAGGPRTGALTVAGRRVTVYQASPAAFTDHPIERGATPVRAIHFLELRARIDALRVGAGRPAFPWTDPVLTPRVTRIRRLHLTELRAALGAAYSAAGRAAPTYTDPGVAAGATAIRAAHLMELRAAVAALE